MATVARTPDAELLLRLRRRERAALTFTVPNLAAGASATFNWGACGVGTYVAIVDRTNVVAESDETNNTASPRNSSCP
jgi:hypothetical protein